MIVAELQQMVDKGVWHGIHMKDLTRAQRKAIIRSTMFLKDKYTADGEFEKFKARLVAGGDGQDKSLYDNLSAPTAATSSVLIVAGIAAAEHRKVMVADIGGAFLNADIKPTGILVHVRLDSLMTSILVRIDPSFKEFVAEDGSSVVQLDKAMYGTVEAASLWHKDLTDMLIKDGFKRNPYDFCVFNKVGPSGKQITVVCHVDDLLITSESISDMDDFERALRNKYKEVTSKRGAVINFIGMTFDFTRTGSVRITMDNLINEILTHSGVETQRATPATETLFDVRDVEKLGTEDKAYFRTYVAKILYLAKRVRPECLTAVAFLSTRVQICDIDDLAKLRRVIGYLRATRDRGIAISIGETRTVKGYIDAAYGVHTASGKSHTGCAIVIGEAGPVYVKSVKQKIVTKSSTEAELVGLSDQGGQVLHTRNFVDAQGYATGPAILYQDNLGTMSLVRKGGPCSERSRHINIRHFWLKEKIDGVEAVMEHLGTTKMFSNMLTKPVQGEQFIVERRGLTNWD